MSLEGYFDYRSPFPYLAIGPFAELARRHGVRAEWLPIRLPALESFAERPMGHTFAKRVAYVGIDMQRWARRRGIEVRTPPALLRHLETTPARETVLGRDHPLSRRSPDASHGHRVRPATRRPPASAGRPRAA